MQDADTAVNAALCLFVREQGEEPLDLVELTLIAAAISHNEAAPAAGRNGMASETKAASRRVLFTMASMLCGTLIPTLAQGQGAGMFPFASPLDGRGWNLTSDDLRRVNAAAERLYQNRSIGTVERWRNPDSRNAGSIKLLRRFEADGMPCWRLQYHTRLEQAQATRSYVTNWCRTAAGEWKMREGGPHA